MKMIVMNSFNIDWRECINEDALSTSILADFYDSLKDDSNIYVIYTKDPCIACPNRDGLKDVFGNPTVGDSPCQWCYYNKWRITC